MSDASVTVMDSRLGVLSDSRGNFEIGPVSAGEYVVLVRRIGFKPARRVVPVGAGNVTLVIDLAQAPISVDAVVVEALATNDPRTHELADLLRVPAVGTANVTTVSREQISEVHAKNPWDLVRETTGLEIHEQGQGPGFASDAVIRGFTSDHSADVALVVDGVPINEPINGHGEGYADWNLIFPEAIADLQVVKGPISPLFGNFAVGGAVNVTTIASTERSSLTVQGGSYETGSVTVTTGSRNSRWGSFVGGHLKRSGGWRPNSDFTTGLVVARANRRLSNRFVLDGGANYYNTSWDSPGYVSVTDFNRGRVRQAADSTDGGEKQRYQFRVGLLSETENGSWLTTVWAYDSHWELFLNIPELGGEGEGFGSQTREIDDRTAYGLRSIARYDIGTWQVQGGVEANNNLANYGIWTSAARTTDRAINRFDASFFNSAAFVSLSRNLGRRLRLEAALRADLIRTGSRDVLRDTDLGAATETSINPKFGAVYYASGEVQFYGSAARGFRAPPALIGSPSLNPVALWDVEFGARVARPDYSIAVSAFRLTTSHERLFNPLTLRVESDGESVREGLEVEASVRPAGLFEISSHWTINTTGDFVLPDTASATLRVAPNLSAVGGPSFSSGSVLHDEEGGGSRVPGVADYVGRAGLRVFPTGRLSLHGWVTFTGPYVPLGEPDIETQPFAVANVKGVFTINHRFELTAGVANIFDTKTAELRASGFVNPGNPRIFEVNLKTQL